MIDLLTLEWSIIYGNKSIQLFLSIYNNDLYHKTKLTNYYKWFPDTNFTFIPTIKYIKSLSDRPLCVEKLSKIICIYHAHEHDVH